MEIQAKRTERVRHILARLTHRYGSLQGAEAALAHDPDALHAVYWFKQVRDNPGLVHETVITTVLADVNAGDVARLSPARLKVLDEVRRRGQANVQKLQEATGRSYRRVQEDVKSWNASVPSRHGPIALNGRASSGGDRRQGTGRRGCA